MKRFNFTLETLAEIRRRKEDAVKLRLAAKNREVLAMQERLSGIDTSLVELQTEERQNRQNCTADVSELKHALTFRHKLQRDIRTATASLATLNKHVDGIRRELTTATKDKKALELLRESRLSDWKYRVHVAEQNFNDDVSQQKYIRTLHKTTQAARNATT